MTSGLLVTLELGLVIGVVLVIALVDVIWLRRSTRARKEFENSSSKSSIPF